MFKRKALVMISIICGCSALIMRFYAATKPSKLEQTLKHISEEYPGISIELSKIHKKNHTATLSIHYDTQRGNTKNYLATLLQAQRALTEAKIHNLSYQYTILDKGKKQRFAKSHFLKRRIRALEQYSAKKPTKLELGTRGEITEDFVRMREDATTQSKIRTYLFKSAVVEIQKRTKEEAEILGQKHYWYKVQTSDNKSGWIYGRYLQASESSKPSSTLHKNRIYQSFQTHKKLLLSSKWHKDFTKKNTTIHAAHLEIHTSKGSIKIPFRLTGQTIKWDINNTKITEPHPHSIPKNLRPTTQQGKKGIKAQISKSHKTGKETPQKNQTNPSPRTKKQNNSTTNPQSSHNTNNIKQIIPGRHKIYNLQIGINLTSQQNTNTHKQHKLKALKKILEYRLYTHDYTRDIRFHERYNPFLDTIHITLTDIDFKKALALYRIERSSFHEASGEEKNYHKAIYTDHWEIRFGEKQNTRLNYENMGDYYYSEILLAFSRSDRRSQESIINLANKTINRLMAQKYI